MYCQLSHIRSVSSSPIWR